LAATRENSSRAPSAFWKLPGPEDLPRHIREVGQYWRRLHRSFAHPRQHPSRTQARGLLYGQRKRDLGSPWAAARSVQPQPTPRIAIDQSDSWIADVIFHERNRTPQSAGVAPRDRALQPISLHSRRLGVSWRLREIWGEIAARGGPPSNEASESAAKADRRPSRPSARGSS